MPTPSATLSIPHRPKRWRLTAALLSATFMAATLTSGAAATPTQASPAADPVVITDWNATAVKVIVVEAGKANAEAFMWYAFTHAAIYNAVNGITGRFELYRWNAKGPRRASPEAAAASAGYHLLLNYFPASQPTLDAALAASLAGIPDGEAKERGVAFGLRAANRIIRLRTNDGRGDPGVIYDQLPGPGVWEPTPPGFAPFFNPWMAKMRPLLLHSTRQFRPNGPPNLKSDRYTAEFNEVKSYGSLTDSLRSDEQTQTALFFSDIAVGPVQASLRDMATRRGLGISASARLFAAVDMSMADAIGVSWDSKLKFAFWRPVTAIQAAADDGNPLTEADADWLPLVVTPPYPEYSAGTPAVIGALTRSLKRVMGTGRIDLYITSAAAGPPGSPLTRYYEFARDLNRDVIDARVWSGIHFRKADVVGNRQGKLVGDWALDHYFARQH